MLPNSQMTTGHATPEMATYNSNIPLIDPLKDKLLTEIKAWTDNIINDDERLSNISRQIAKTVTQSAQEGNFILARSEEDIRKKLQIGQAALIPAYDDIKDQETFRYFRGMTPLTSPRHFNDFPIIEGGTLIANVGARLIQGSELYRSSHAIQIANSLPFLPQNALIINTSRALLSKRAGLRAGTVQLRREYFPMLDALTCDPSCAPSKDDGRPAGINTVIQTECGDCIACPVNQAYGGEKDNLSDSCGLYTPNSELAIEYETKLRERFKGSAVLARSVLIEDRNETN